MSFCEHCVKGVTHEGEPQGKWEEINGVNSYIATPSKDYPKDKVLIFLTDAFGPQLVNNRLLVDDFAANGFKTVMPDIFSGDAAPVTAFKPGSTFNLGEWFKSHGPEQTRPLIDKTIEGLKKEGVTSFGVLGYCFGGRYAFDLAFDGIPKAVAVAHPSLLKIPDDLEVRLVSYTSIPLRKTFPQNFASKATAPLLINSCTTDPQFPLEAQAKADEILGDGKYAPGYKREYFEGCTHGFAVRGDMSDPKVKAGKEGAFKASVEWMIRYL
ncbi:dienelactone hydrolase endo-1,3,1,4-beta-D-glucanase [Lentinula raphanica]|nr:dienelactone hydrolase endo-1,3,1,4-beta-D-glucanase [Lentinula raphanica]